MEATPKQINFAKALGIEGAENYTKDALSRMIMEKTGKKNGEESKPKESFKSPPNEFHLSPEQVRTNALQSAIQSLRYFAPEDHIIRDQDIITMAKKYEAYLNGENQSG